MRARDPLPTHELPAVDAADEDGHASAAADAAADDAAATDEARAAVPCEPAPLTEPQPPAPPAADFAYVPKAEPAAAGRAVAPAAAAPREALPELPAAAPPVVEWPPDDQRHILALRLVAPQPERFAGRSLRQALAAEGFVLGRFAIFHKPDEERRAVLSAASLNAPRHLRRGHDGLAALRRPVAVRGAARSQAPAAGLRRAGIHRAQPE